ncbi:hypothetical protein [Paenibacillus sp. 1P07SE]|uniref:hypothetical protein n=1 Tax=Paenibacillus sp. 1P07SE TaxID=3132209 RepID=UPI0039A75F91
MSMKKSLVITALVTALSTASVSSITAAPATQGAIQSIPLLINQSHTTARSVEVNGVPMFSLRDLGTAAHIYFAVEGKSVVAWDGLNRVELSNNSAAARKNGSPVTLRHGMVKVDQSYFIALEDFLFLFDADLEQGASGTASISTVQKLKGADRAVWIDARRLLASQITDEGRVDYIVDAASGVYAELMTSDDASDLVVAPSGKLAVYTLEDGSVHLVNLITLASSQLSADDTIKTELVWAADSSAIYFLQGDKGSVIAKISPMTGSISKVLEDKVDYKSNLAVSKDGKSFYYSVVKPGAVKTDSAASVDDDEVSIDMTGTEPQIYYYDAAAEEPKPIALTSDTNDKWLIGAAGDGSKAYYISIEDGQRSKLISIGRNQQATTLLRGGEVLYAVMAGSSLYVVVDEQGEESIYELKTATDAATKLYALPESFTHLVAGPGTPLAVLTDNHVHVNRDGQWMSVIKQP